MEGAARFSLSIGLATWNPGTGGPFEGLGFRVVSGFGV